MSLHLFPIIVVFRWYSVPSIVLLSLFKKAACHFLANLIESSTRLFAEHRV